MSARIALQSGATSVRSLALAGVGVYVGGGSVLLFVVPSAVAHVIGLLPLLLGASIAIWALRSARKRRASDLIVDEDGIVIEGGPEDALSYGWPEVVGARIERNDREYEQIGSTREYRHDLILCVRDGSEPRLAESVDAAERMSLTAIADGVQAACDWRRPRGEPSPRTAKRADVVVCPGCGAAVAPADAEVVACHYCGTAAPMPPAVRARIVDTLEDARRLEALIAQPGARRTNVLIVLVAVAALTSPAWIAALHAGGLAISIGILGVAWGTAQRAVADRIALRTLIVGLAPRAPAAEGHPYGCRRCGAPLTVPTTPRPIVACAYCSARNVIAFGAFARRDDGAVSEQHDDEIASAFARRKAARLSTIVTIVLSLAIAFAGVAYARRDAVPRRQNFRVTSLTPVAVSSLALDDHGPARFRDADLAVETLHERAGIGRRAERAPSEDVDGVEVRADLRLSAIILDGADLAELVGANRALLRRDRPAGIGAGVGCIVGSRDGAPARHRGQTEAQDA